MENAQIKPSNLPCQLAAPDYRNGLARFGQADLPTVKEFQAHVRDRRAGYNLSLKVIRNVKQMSSSIYIKPSLMLGFGETEDMILKTMDDLRSAGVSILTLGQYLMPTRMQLEVKEYISPEKFEYYRKIALEKGFISVMSGPFVRSSYKAQIFLFRKD